MTPSSKLRTSHEDSETEVRKIKSNIQAEEQTAYGRPKHPRRRRFGGEAQIVNGERRAVSVCVSANLSAACAGAKRARNG